MDPKTVAEINEVVTAAGTLLRGLAQDPSYRAPMEKSDGSPVTKADLEVSAFLVQNLEKFGYPVVSEEGDLHEGCQTPYFLVDPIDGTKHFVKGSKDYAVLVAFLENQQPVLGSIYSPAEKRLYWAHKGHGAFLNGQLLDREAPPAKIRVYSSGFHKRANRQWLKDAFSMGPILYRGSALKFCDIAEGVADFFPRFGPTGEWDTAAAQVILEESQCALVDMKTGRPMAYGKPGRLNSGLIACHKSLLDKVVRVLREYFESVKKEGVLSDEG